MLFTERAPAPLSVTQLYCIHLDERANVANDNWHQDLPVNIFSSKLLVISLIK